MAGCVSVHLLRLVGLDAWNDERANLASVFTRCEHIRWCVPFCKSRLEQTTEERHFRASCQCVEFLACAQQLGILDHSCSSFQFRPGKRINDPGWVIPNVRNMGRPTPLL